MVSGSCGYAICAAPPYLNSMSSRSPHQGQGINTLVRHGRGAMLVDEGPGGESFQGEGRVERVRLSIRDRMRVNPAGGWRRLEAAGAPAAVDEEVLDRCQSEDRRGVRRDIDDARPGPQRMRPLEDRE